MKAADVLKELEKHEAECSIRYKNIEEQLKLMPSGRRNEVKQSLKRDAEIKTYIDTDEFLEKFYPLYCSTMNRKKVTPLAKDYFLNFFESNNKSTLNILAEKENEVLSFYM